MYIHYNRYSAKFLGLRGTNGLKFDFDGRSKVLAFFPGVKDSQTQQMIVGTGASFEFACLQLDKQIQQADQTGTLRIEFETPELILAK